VPIPTQQTYAGRAGILIDLHSSEE